MNSVSLFVKQIFHKRKGVILGRKVNVFHTARLSAKKGGKIVVGHNSLLNENVFLCASGGTIDIGDNVSINRNSIIVCKSKVIIGSGSSLGPNVCIYDHNHRIGKNGFYKSEFTVGAITIGKNVWIAANCTILKGVTIGDNSIIGAGCVVSLDVPANTLVKTDRTIQMIPLHE